MRHISFLLALSLCFAQPAGAAPDFTAAGKTARELLGQLVGADTSNPPGNEARIARIGEKRLGAAGIPARRTAFAPGRENLVARLEGNGSEAPLLLMAHIDVVGARADAWTTPPHEMVEKDGYLYGRGVADDLGMAAVELVVFELLKANQVKLRRDVILAWTGDEESGGAGIQWLLENEPESIRAAGAINEGGGLRLDAGGVPARIDLQTAEKIYEDFTLTVEGPTGHSSVPVPENSIYRLAQALLRIEAYSFPPRLLPVTRAWLQARASIEKEPTATAMQTLADADNVLPQASLDILMDDPLIAASLKTTCVATLLNAGSRVNALPGKATANLNCRILPDSSPAAVQAQLVAVINDPKVRIEATGNFGSGTPSPIAGEIPEAILRLGKAKWPEIQLLPFMSRGATDSRFLRAAGIPSYGISPILISDEDGRRMHGIDERIPAKSLQTAVEFLYALVVDLAAVPER
jgi:acetylornithine deacetylase/succinyl-diaminopimelate desuccinylase-like protein